MAHSQALLRLYDKLNPNGRNNRKNDLIVPRFITLMAKCVEHKIPDVFIARTHFTDLYVLLLSLDIANIKMQLKQKSKRVQADRNVNVRDISQADAVKFLKGGGNG